MFFAKKTLFFAKKFADFCKLCNFATGRITGNAEERPANVAQRTLGVSVKWGLLAYWQFPHFDLS